MMTMLTDNGDFTHLSEVAYARVRDTATQHKMQLGGDDAPQRWGIINRGRKNTNKIRHIQVLEFNIMDIIGLDRLKSVLRCGNSPQIRRLTPPSQKRRGCKSEGPPHASPQKKFPRPHDMRC